MSLLYFSPADLPVAIGEMAGFIRENPILCSILFISYFLFYIYSFMNNASADSEIYEIDLLSSGVSSMMICLLLLGLDDDSKGFSLAGIDFGSSTTRVAVFLLAYALILILFAFIKILPRFMVVVLGNSELDVFINFTAVLLTDSNIALTATHFVAIAAPLLLLFIAQRLRRKKGH